MLYFNKIKKERKLNTYIKGDSLKNNVYLIDYYATGKIIRAKGKVGGLLGKGSGCFPMLILIKTNQF